MVGEKKQFYYVCIHPLACSVNSWLFNLPKRIGLSIILSFLLTLVSQIHPICTEDFCYTILLQTIINPDLLVKSFSFEFIFIPTLFTFVFLTLFWFAVLSLFSALQKIGKIHELIIPIVGIILFVYIAFLISGTIGPFILHTGIVECIDDSDCILAGYVGEVCTSVYRQVYTEFSEDLEPLTTCGCVNNKCVGS